MRRTFGIGLAVAAFALAVGCGKTSNTTGADRHRGRLDARRAGSAG